MFHHWSDRTVAAVAFVVTVTCITILLIIGPAPTAQGESSAPTYTTGSVCTHPDKALDDCGPLLRYNSGPVHDEGLKAARIASRLTGKKVVYLGWTTRLLTYNPQYLRIQSTMRADRWHMLRIEG
jgi:hypothetical protein